MLIISFGLPLSLHEAPQEEENRSHFAERVRANKQILNSKSNKHKHVDDSVKVVKPPSVWFNYDMKLAYTQPHWRSLQVFYMKGSGYPRAFHNAFML